ncbi:MAG: DNA integrity scanning protein DisA nucleotide-binding domain protein [Elusimicrobia bacterium]|nr:DNA integrity scanning protein DisA nucleotide-binding domain protein [Elusimicrobiota bacterium]MDE2424770.1 DNA integrity scanning protein DisA nucleotide-binding domain protein [Elusimicrobiota bacterium]
MTPLKSLALPDVLDIAFVAVLVYALLIWFKKTKTAFVAMGLLMLALVYTIARIMGMFMTVWIFQGFFAVLIIAIIVIFQEELRHVFERIAVWSLHGRGYEQPAPRLVEVLMTSLAEFAQEKIGALIVLHGRDPLDRHLDGGWDLNGELSEALLESILDSHSLGHDGAVVIENGRVTKFGVHLPLSKEFSKINNLGTRHTAALGMSERSDALCLVVSEERGTISVARDGRLAQMPDLRSLQAEIERFLAEKAPRPAKGGFLLDFFKHNLREKGIALTVSILLWLFFIGIGPR